MATDSKELELLLKEKVMASLGREGDISQEGLYRIIDRVLLEESSVSYIALCEKLRLREKLFNSFRKLDVLQELLDDDSITEIMINGPNDIFIEKNSRIVRWNGKFESEEKLENIIQQIVSRINRRVNTLTPIADARLPEEPTFIISILEMLISL